MENVLERMERIDAKKRIADFMVKEQMPYSFKVKYARIRAQYDRPMTMASLFDGIGGFPLVFSRAGCTPVWASEIEDFPIEVTRRRFPE